MGIEYETLKDHYLEPAEVDDETKIYYLRQKPDSMMMATIIIFTHGRIILMGDLTPRRYGNISVCGYGEDWFSQKLSPSYLAEKFDVIEKYEEERAIREAKEWLKDQVEELWTWRDENTLAMAKKVRDLLEENRWAFEDSTTLHQELLKIDPYLVEDGVWGWGYCTSEYNWLSAIQKRFSELYQKEKK
jgi:hypothetical protein